MMFEVAIGWPDVSDCDALQAIVVVPVALWHDTVTSDAAIGIPAHEPADVTSSVAVRFLPLFFGTVKFTVADETVDAASGSDAVSVRFVAPVIDVIVGAAK
jgi:hypothetical protein